MKHLTLQSNPKVQTVFNSYPEAVRKKLLHLRGIILATANNIPEVSKLEETLKWGEPSYITKIGSTLRIDWKSKQPNQYALYFQCTSKLVATFRMIYKNTFKFEGNRAIVFHLEDELPVEALEHCIRATLTYHKVKHLPTLGI